MSALALVFENRDLQLRSTARSDRARLLVFLVEKGSATLDFSRVEAMSPAYADELFGVLTHYFGRSWVLRQVGVRGAHELIVRTIAEAICQRAQLRRPRAGLRRTSRASDEPPSRFH